MRAALDCLLPFFTERVRHWRQLPSRNINQGREKSIQIATAETQTRNLLSWLRFSLSDF